MYPARVRPAAAATYEACAAVTSPVVHDASPASAEAAAGVRSSPAGAAAMACSARRIAPAGSPPTSARAERYISIAAGMRATSAASPRRKTTVISGPRRRNNPWGCTVTPAVTSAPSG